MVSIAQRLQLAVALQFIGHGIARQVPQSRARGLHCNRLQASELEIQQATRTISHDNQSAASPTPLRAYFSDVDDAERPGSGFSLVLQVIVPYALKRRLGNKYEKSETSSSC